MTTVQGATPSTAGAKARAAKRAREGGGVIFIVAMTLAVLAALGAFALQASSMEIKTAGYERQSSQTHYLSEYGVLAAMQNLTPKTAQLYVGLMSNQPDTGCTSLPGLSYVTANKYSKACRRMGSAEMAIPWNLPTGTTPVTAWGGSVTAPGSLGIIPVTGDFYMEMTEPTIGPMLVGNDTANGLCPVEFTVSSYGLTRPSNTGSNTTALYAGQGLEVARARIVGGPVQVAGCGGK